MTTPRDPDSRQSMAPVRRRSTPTPPPAAPHFDEAEIARGQADALLGALGRMQIRLDLLSREQADHFDRIASALERLNERLDALSPAAWDQQERRP